MVPKANMAEGVGRGAADDANPRRRRHARGERDGHVVLMEVAAHWRRGVAWQACLGWRGAGRGEAWRGGAWRGVACWRGVGCGKRGGGVVESVAAKFEG